MLLLIIFKDYVQIQISLEVLGKLMSEQFGSLHYFIIKETATTVGETLLGKFWTTESVKPDC